MITVDHIFDLGFFDENKQSYTPDEVKQMINAYMELAKPSIIHEAIHEYFEFGNIPDAVEYDYIRGIYNQLHSNAVINNLNILDIIKAIRSSFGDAVKVYTKGSCVKFAIILNEIFPQGQIYYYNDHAIFELNGKYYDVTGEVEKKSHIPLSEYGILNAYKIMSLKYDAKI